MTAAVGPYAVEEGMVDIVEPITTVRMLNRNTDKYINVTVPIDPEPRHLPRRVTVLLQV